MSMTFHKLMAPVAAVVASITFAGAAYADPAAAKAAVDAAKAQGVVGEQADGFLGFVNAGAASADVRAAVAEINAGRRQLYSQAAARTASARPRRGLRRSARWCRPSCGPATSIRTPAAPG
jgi:uncharacterized protein YdbL (DUF1318 family)